MGYTRLGSSIMTTPRRKPTCGIRLKNRATRLLRRIFRIRRRGSSGVLKVNPLSSFLTSCRNKLRRTLGGKGGERAGSRSGYYARLGDYHEVEERERITKVPKGHVAVYVAGKKEDEEKERVVVPVIYVNHPLFGRLLREAEEKYGFDHPGGITIPCHVSELKVIQGMIAANRKDKSCRLSLSLAS